MTALPVVEQSTAISVKIFNQIADMPSGCGRAARVTDMTGVEPMQELAQPPKTGVRSAMPKLTFGRFKLSNRKGAKIGAVGARAQTTRGLRSVLKAHCDMPPVEDERSLRHDLALQFPQSGIAVG